MGLVRMETNADWTRGAILQTDGGRPSTAWPPGNGLPQISCRHDSRTEGGRIVKIREFWSRLAFWSRRERLARELSDEVQAHIDLLARDFEREGMSPADALATARRRIGNIGQLHE